MPFDPSWATTTIGGVPCAESVHGTEEGIGRGQGPQLTKVYQCAWPYRYRVANALLGVTTVFTSGGPVSFNLPLSHPESPNAFAADISITGKGRPQTGQYGLAFDMAEITVRYAAPAYGIVPGPMEAMQSFDPNTTFIYATQNITQGEESVEVQGSALQYAGGQPYNKPMMVPVAHAILTITYLDMPYLPVDTIQYYGSVNDSTFLGVPKGKCLFKGSNTNRNWSTDGNPTQTVSNTYFVRPSWEWNKFPPPVGISSSDWIYVTYKNGDYIFPYKNHMNTLVNGYYIGGN